MSIQVKCPSCGTTLRVKDALAGKRVKCPRCANPFRVPQAATEEVYDAEVHQPNEFEGLDFGGFDPSAGEAVEQRRPCPACGEMIMERAAKCRYCGEILDPELKKRAKKKKKKSRASSGDDSDDDMSTGDWLAAVFCSGIACIVGLVWMIQGKPKGLKMVGASILSAFLWNVMNILMQMAAEVK